MATFFFDNDISFRVVAALRQLVNPADGHELFALRDKFPESEKDLDWIPEAGKQGWVVISKDHNQRRRAAEHRALRANNVKALYIRQSGLNAELFADAARIISCWPKIVAWGMTSAPGTLAKVDTKNQIVNL